VEVTNAYQSFSNAAMQYQAQRENHEAQRLNLEFVQKRFENGQATYFELQLAKNQELMAYQNFLSNKYEAALRNLILDVMYRGDLTLLKP
jgi:outer membrane protein TolC